MPKNFEINNMTPFSIALNPDEQKIKIFEPDFPVFWNIIKNYNYVGYEKKIAQ